MPAQASPAQVCPGCTPAGHVGGAARHALPRPCSSSLQSHPGPKWRQLGQLLASGRQCCQPLRRSYCGTASSCDEEPLLSGDEILTSGSDNEQPSGQAQGGQTEGGSMRRDRWRIPIPPQLHGKAPRRHWNANALAFLGDSVWELYARRRFFYPPSRKDSYFSQVVLHVRAETQEQLYQRLLSSGFLTDAERDVLRWGRNATGVAPKRLSDTGLKRETYRAATAMECLCGYLYLSDPQRLHDMMCLLGLGDAPVEGEDGGGGGGSSGSGSGSGAADGASITGSSFWDE